MLDSHDQRYDSHGKLVSWQLSFSPPSSPGMPRTPTPPATTGPANNNIGNLIVVVDPTGVRADTTTAGPAPARQSRTRSLPRPTASTNTAAPFGPKPSVAPRN